jgi:hypothetical protein
MDEALVREQAEAHGKATVAGDLATAGKDLTKEAMAGAGAVMKEMPKPLTSSEIDSVEADGAGFVVQIRYAGDDSSIVVRSRWEEQDGRPKIVDLSIA